MSDMTSIHLGIVGGYDISLSSSMSTQDGVTYYSASLSDSYGGSGYGSYGVNHGMLDGIFNNGLDTSSSLATRSLSFNNYTITLPTLSEFSAFSNSTGGIIPGGWGQPVLLADSSGGDSHLSLTQLDFLNRVSGRVTDDATNGNAIFEVGRAESLSTSGTITNFDVIFNPTGSPVSTLTPTDTINRLVIQGGSDINFSFDDDVAGTSGTLFGAGVSGSNYLTFSTAADGKAFNAIATGAGNDFLQGSDSRSEVFAPGEGANVIIGGDGQGKIDYVDYRGESNFSANFNNVYVDPLEDPNAIGLPVSQIDPELESISGAWIPPGVFESKLTTGVTIVLEDNGRSIVGRSSSEFLDWNDDASVSIDNGNKVDEITSVEGVLGSMRDDFIVSHLTGTAVLAGFDGNDVIYGGDGSDVLIGGAGNDRLYGSRANASVGEVNVIEGGAGDDVMYTSAGKDLFFVSLSSQTFPLPTPSPMLSGDISSLSSQQISALSTSELASLSTAQVSSLGSAQVAALSTGQLSALYLDTIQPLPTQDLDKIVMFGLSAPGAGVLSNSTLIGDEIVVVSDQALTNSALSMSGSVLTITSDGKSYQAIINTGDNNDLRTNSYFDQIRGVWVDFNITPFIIDAGLSGIAPAPDLAVELLEGSAYSDAMTGEGNVTRIGLKSERTGVKVEDSDIKDVAVGSRGADIIVLSGGGGDQAVGGSGSDLYEFRISSDTPTLDIGTTTIRDMGSRVAGINNKDAILIDSIADFWTDIRLSRGVDGKSLLINYEQSSFDNGIYTTQVTGDINVVKQFDTKAPYYFIEKLAFTYADEPSQLSVFNFGKSTAGSNGFNERITAVAFDEQSPFNSHILIGTGTGSTAKDQYNLSAVQSTGGVVVLQDFDSNDQLILANGFRYKFFDYNVSDIEGSFNSAGINFAANTILSNIGKDALIMVAMDAIDEDGDGIDDLFIDANGNGIHDFGESRHDHWMIVAGGNSQQLSAIESSQLSLIDAAPPLPSYSTLDVTLLTPENIAALTPAEIRMLSTSQVGLLLGTQIAAFTAEQVRILSTSQFSTLTNLQIASLDPNLVSDIETRDLASMTTSAITGIITRGIANLSTNQVTALATSQISALLTRQVATFDALQVGALSSTQSAAISTAGIAALSTSALSALSVEALASLKTAQIVALSTYSIAALTTTQIAGLTGVQLSSLRTIAMQALMTAQIKAIETRDISSLTTAQIVAFTARQFQALDWEQITNLATKQVAAIQTPNLAVLSDVQIAAFSSTQLSSLTTQQIGTLSPVQDTYETWIGGTYFRRANQIAAIGEDISSLKTSQIASLATSQYQGLSGNQITALTTAQISIIAPSYLSSSQIRFIETVDVVALSTSQFLGLGTNQVSAFDTNQIRAIETRDISVLLTYQISMVSTAQISSLTTAQVVALTTQQVAALTSQQVSALTTTQLPFMETNDLVSLQTGAISNLLTAQISSLTTAQVVALTTSQFFAFVGLWHKNQILGFTTTQIAAIETRDIAVFSCDQLTGLSTDQLVAMTTAQITSLQTIAISGLSTHQVSGFTTAQVVALTTSQFVAITNGMELGLHPNYGYGNWPKNLVQGFTTAQIAAIETADIAVFSSAGLGYLGTNQVSALTTAQIQAIPVATWYGDGFERLNLTSYQISALMTDDVVALTTRQVAALTSVQVSVLTTTQTAVLETQDLASLQTGAISNLLTAQISSLTTAQVAALTTSQFVAITNGSKTEYAYNPIRGSWDYWPKNLVQGFTTAQIAAIETRDIAVWSSMGLIYLNTNQISALTTDQIQTLPITPDTGWRYDYGGMVTIETLALTSAQLGGLETQDVMALTTRQVSSLTSAQFRGLRTEQISVIETRDISVLQSGVINNISTEQISALTTTQVVALTTTQFMAFNVLPYIGTGGQMSGFTTAQIAAIETWDIAWLSTRVLNSLMSNQVQALTTDQIASISVVNGYEMYWSPNVYFEYYGSLSSIGSTLIMAFGTDDIAALTTTQFSALSMNIVPILSSAQVTAIETNDIRALGSRHFAVMSSVQLTALSTAQVAAMTTSALVYGLYSQQVSTLSTNQIAALSTAALDLFSSATITAMTSIQFAALMTAQINILDSQQVIAMDSIDFSALGTSQIAAFSTQALAYGVTAADLMILGKAQVAALSTNVIDVLSADSISVLGSAQVGALATSQVSVLDSQQVVALSSVQTGSFSTAQIAAMSTSALGYGLTANQISALSTAQVWTLGASVVDMFSSWSMARLTSSQLGVFSTAQMAILDSAQIRAIDSNDLTAFSTAQLASISNASAVGFTSQELRALTSMQMSAFSTAQLSYIQSSSFAYMSSTQLLGMSTAGIAALGMANGGYTSTQLDYIFSQQINAISTVAAVQLAKFGFVTPVVMDLNGDGIQTTTAENGVTFDINNDGKADQTAWVARGDGLLVRDINKDGQINNGSELFGSATSLGKGMTAADGYAAMRALDTNKDGVLDAKDAAFGELMVWTDIDGNGVTGANELTNLSDLGINSISLNATKSTENNNGNLIGLMGSYTTTDGKTHTMGDVWFQTDAAGERVFDLAAIARAAGTSKVDMSNAQADTLKVTLADVLAVGTPDILSGTSTVTITGDSGDVVHLTGAAGSGWSLAGTQTDGADTYMVYVNQNAHLMVNDKIHLIIS
ncbi:MAG: hypothetical protein K9J78_06435 [Polynucleobacter sp.]|nr:hypothetical protein [Polynucleobacter sp.]